MTATAEPTTEAPLRLVLAGRSFREVGRTISAIQDDWLTPHLHAAGLYDYLKGAMQMAEGETPGAFFERLVLRIKESRQTFYIVAGMVEEDGREVPHDPDPDAFEALMRERVRFLAGLRDPSDRELLGTYVCELVLRFFARGLASLETFLTSSADGPDADSPPEKLSADPLARSHPEVDPPAR